MDVWGERPRTLGQLAPLSIAGLANNAPATPFLSPDERPSYRLCWYGQSVHYLKTLCRQKKVTLSILCQQILNRSRICPPLNLFIRLDFRKKIILTRRALGADVTSTTSSGSLQTELYFVDSLRFSALQMLQPWFLSHRIWYWVRSENLVIYKNLRKWKHQELQDNLWFSNP